MAFVRVETTSGEEAPEVERVVPPSLEVHVTVNDVMALPPLPLAVNATLAELVPRVARPIVGALGTLPATNELVADDEALAPNVFVAVAAHV